MMNRALESLSRILPSRRSTNQDWLLLSSTTHVSHDTTHVYITPAVPLCTKTSSSIRTLVLLQHQSPCISHPSSVFASWHWAMVPQLSTPCRKATGIALLVVPLPARTRANTALSLQTLGTSSPHTVLRSLLIIASRYAEMCAVSCAASSTCASECRKRGKAANCVVNG